MGKKKKNSNYVTAKREQARLEKERLEKKRKTLKTVLIASISVVLVAAIIVGLGFAFGWWNSQLTLEETPSFEETRELYKKLKEDQDFKATHHATINIKDYGSVHIELYGKEAPKTVANFVKLVEAGHYDNLTFHRIVEGFMAQGGNNPDSEIKRIKGEFYANGIGNDIKHVRGTISMARTDIMDSATDQFFIVHETSDNNTVSLDGRYAAFGMVTSGMDIIDKMIADAVAKGYSEYVSPEDQPIIESITIHEAHD